jgi:hypothetical protein
MLPLVVLWFAGRWRIAIEIVRIGLLGEPILSDDMWKWCLATLHRLAIS